MHAAHPSILKRNNKVEHLINKRASSNIATLVTSLIKPSRSSPDLVKLDTPLKKKTLRFSSAPPISLLPILNAEDDDDNEEECEEATISFCVIPKHCPNKDTWLKCHAPIIPTSPREQKTTRFLYDSDEEDYSMFNAHTSPDTSTRMLTPKSNRPTFSHPIELKGATAEQMDAYYAKKVYVDNGIDDKSLLFESVNLVENAIAFVWSIKESIFSFKRG